MVVPRKASKIKVETRREGYVSYFTNFEICQSTIEHFWRPLGEDKEDLRKLGANGSALVQKIFALPGVTEVFISPYQLSVMISHAFHWKEVEPQVFRIIKEVFGFKRLYVFGPDEEVGPKPRPKKVTAPPEVPARIPWWSRIANEVRKRLSLR